MFKKLKEKLSKWTKKVSEEEIEQPDQEESVKQVKESKEKETSEKQNLPEKITPKPIKTTDTNQKSEKNIQLKDSIAKNSDKVKSKTTKEKEIEIPKKFNIGTQKFEPDIEKIQEIKKELENKEPSKKEKKKFFNFSGKTTISKEKFNESSEELELLLLENNVALEVVDKILKELKEKIIGKEIPKKELEEKISETLKEIIENILIEPENLIQEILDKKDSPYVILMCGINGTGKTTTTAKLANLLKQKDISVVMAAADTFRAASIEQIKKHGEKLDIKVISSDYGSDPASVGFDAIKTAKKNSIKCVLIDTAGRMHTDKNLLREIEKISRICNPDKKIFIGESITGNDSVEQIKNFNESIGIDGIILTKADIDEKGGTALSLGHVTKKPILFLGTGQNYNDLEVFNKKDFIEKLGL